MVSRLTILRKSALKKFIIFQGLEMRKNKLKLKTGLLKTKKISVNRLAYTVRLLNKCPELTFDEALQKVSDNKKDNPKVF